MREHAKRAVSALLGTGVAAAFGVGRVWFRYERGAKLESVVWGPFVVDGEEVAHRGGCDWWGSGGGNGRMPDDEE